MPNYTEADRPETGPVACIVMHCTEQNFDRSVDLLRNRTDASAHYLVRASDGFILSLVDERHIAWHCGNRDINARSIGVEVEGYVSRRDKAGEHAPFAQTAYVEAARLVREICTRHSIVPSHYETRLPNGGVSDGYPGTIFGHDQVPDPENPTLGGGRNHHLDPGAAWDWDHFLAMVLDQTP